MNIKLSSIPLFFALLSLTACDEGELAVQEVEIPQGYAPSAGASTVFENSTFAYDTEAPWVGRSSLYRRFLSGDALYDDTQTMSSGLGPVYAGYACGSCHINAGRTTPGVWTPRADGTYGTNPSGFSAMLCYITRRNGAFFQDYGRVLHDQSIYGVDAEGKVTVNWRYEKGTFPDGEPYELAAPTYTITEWYKPDPHGQPIRPEDLFITVRIPLRHVGLGPMMALDPKEIEALARKSNYPEYGISGRANYVFERGRMQLGLSGNKAHHADLTVELGFSSDMGVTNSRYPEEVSEGQKQIAQGGAMGLRYHQLEIGTKEMEDVDLYLHALGVPARRDVNDPQVQLGEKMFYQAKCHLCHVPTLHTRPRGATLLAGTELPWLGNQTIHPYSDYLLHDMGSEIMGVGLNDNYVSGLARGTEWRTTPLWGIGLQQKVNGHTYFLHDGRARNFKEAILWHGGEGEASKNLFRKMNRTQRDALVRFLQSL